VLVPWAKRLEQCRLAQRNRVDSPFPTRNLFSAMQDAKTEPEMKKARQRRAFAYVLPETRQPTRTVLGDEDCQAITINFITPRLGLLLAGCGHFAPPNILATTTQSSDTSCQLILCRYA
jgi:hypothetical protein